MQQSSPATNRIAHLQRSYLSTRQLADTIKRRNISSSASSPIVPIINDSSTLPHGMSIDLMNHIVRVNDVNENLRRSIVDAQLTPPLDDAGRYDPDTMEIREEVADSGPLEMKMTEDVMTIVDGGSSQPIIRDIYANTDVNGRVLLNAVRMLGLDVSALRAEVKGLNVKGIVKETVDSTVDEIVGDAIDEAVGDRLEVINDKLNAKANAANVYGKNRVYTKDEVDALLSAAVDVAEVNGEWSDVKAYIDGIAKGKMVMFAVKGGALGDGDGCCWSENGKVAMLNVASGVYVGSRSGETWVWRKVMTEEVYT